MIEILVHFIEPIIEFIVHIIKVFFRVAFEIIFEIIIHGTGKLFLIIIGKKESFFSQKSKALGVYIWLLFALTFYLLW